MPSNILRFDPSGTNMLNDADYNSSAQRANGVVPGIAQSSLHNKLFFQVSTVSAALAEALSNLGYTMSDSNYAGMVTNFQTELSKGQAFTTISSKSVGYNITTTDRAYMMVATAALTFTFTAAATLGAGWYCYVKNNSAGLVVLDPNGAETIDGATTITMNPYEGFMIFCTGTAFLTVGRDLTILPSKFMAGPPVRYNAAPSVIIPTGLSLRSSDNTMDLNVTGDLTVSLAVAGANGLDTGAEASNTWYYLYVIGNPTTGATAGLWSVTNESVSGSVTLPAGYTKKRQLPFAARNDASSNLIPFYIENWGMYPTVYWDVNFPNSSTEAVGETKILDNGAAAAFTSVSAASFVPPIARIAILMATQATSATISYFRAAGSSLTSGTTVRGYDEEVFPQFTVPTSSAQAIEYKTTSTRLDVCVKGFTVTTGAF